MKIPDLVTISVEEALSLYKSGVRTFPHVVREGEIAITVKFDRGTNFRGELFTPSGQFEITLWGFDFCVVDFDTYSSIRLLNEGNEEFTIYVDFDFLFHVSLEEIYDTEAFRGFIEDYMGEEGMDIYERFLIEKSSVHLRTKLEKFVDEFNSQIIDRVNRLLDAASDWVRRFVFYFQKDFEKNFWG